MANEITSRLDGFWIYVESYNASTLTFRRDLAPDEAGHTYQINFETQVTRYADLDSWTTNNPPVAGQHGWLWVDEATLFAPGLACTCNNPSHTPPVTLGGPDRWMSSRGFHAYWGTVLDVLGTEVVVEVPGEENLITIPDWFCPYYVWAQHPYAVQYPARGVEGWFLFGPGTESQFEAWGAGYKYPQDAGGPGAASTPILCDVEVTDVNAASPPMPSTAKAARLRYCRTVGRLKDAATGSQLVHGHPTHGNVDRHALALGNGNHFQLNPYATKFRHVMHLNLGRGLKQGSKLLGVYLHPEGQDALGVK